MKSLANVSSARWCNALMEARDILLLVIMIAAGNEHLTLRAFGKTVLQL